MDFDQASRTRLTRAIREVELLANYKTTSSESVEEELVYHLVEILESFRDVMDKQAPIVHSATNANQTSESIFEIREELRHVYYHIKSSVYLSSILD